MSDTNEIIDAMIKDRENVLMQKHATMKHVYIFRNGNVAVTDAKEQIVELQGDIFQCALKLSKYDLSDVEILEQDTDRLFSRMLRRAREMRFNGFSFDCEKK